MKSIAVFIPIYNGEPYLRSTIQSILNQSYKHFKVYCVNDSSQDNSLEIIQEFSTLDNRIVHYTKEQGGGTAKSWNFILPKIKEDFIFYMSQDDLISSDVFQKMVERQAETDAECILPDMVWYHENESDHEKIVGSAGDRSATLTGIEALGKSLQWQIHGFALRKIELYKDEQFFVDTFDTDEYMTRKLFYKSKKVAFSSGSFFYRQDNPNAITKSFGIKNYYSLLTYLRVYSLLLKSEQLKNEKTQWFSMIAKNYLIFVENYRKKKGLHTTHEIADVKKLLKKIRVKLLFHLFSFGNLRTKAYWIKKIYLSKTSKINL